MRIRWTEQAREDLRAQIARIARDRPATARVVAQRIRERVRTLAEQPEVGRVVPEFDDEDLRELIVQSWRIVYRVEGEVLVLRVWHVRRSLRPPSPGDG